MIELTAAEAHAIKDDVHHLESLKQSNRIREITDTTNWGKRWVAAIKEDIDLLEKKIKVKACLLSCQSLTDIDEAICHAINAESAANARHITIDDLPPAPRSPGLPKRQTAKTRAKKQARFISQMQRITHTTTPNRRWDSGRQRYVNIPRDDRITHIATGKVWDRQTGATADEFLVVV